MMMATKAAGTMPEPPKMSCIAWGRPESTALLAPRPYAQAQATDTMDMFRPVRGSLVMSWIPLMTMEENMMTAAPPSTLWGMMEMMAASLGEQAAQHQEHGALLGKVPGQLDAAVDDDHQSHHQGQDAQALAGIQTAEVIQRAALELAVLIQVVHGLSRGFFWIFLA